MVNLKKEPDQLSEIKQSVNALNKTVENLTDRIGGLEKNLTLLLGILAAKPILDPLQQEGIQNTYSQVLAAQTQAVSPSYIATCCCDYRNINR